MKILVRMPNWLGDMVMSSAFLNALHHNYPEAEIHLIVKDGLQDLGAFLPGKPVIHPFNKKDFGGISGALRFGRTFRHYRFDIFFSLPDSFSAALMGWASGSKKRIGYQKEGRSLLLTKSFRKPEALHRVEEYISLLEQFTNKIIEQKKAVLYSRPANPVDNFLIINFNSEATSRRMPVEKGRKIIQSLVENFPGIKLGFIGSQKESDFIERVTRGFLTSYSIENFAGKTGLKTLTELLSTAKLVISTDSGPAHLANSLGIPVLVLFGAGNELKTAPYNKHGLEILRAGMLPCEPCVKNKCPLYDIPECMNLLEIQRINQYVKLYLDNA